MNQPREIVGPCSIAAVLVGVCFTIPGCSADHPAVYPVLGEVRFDDGTPVGYGFVEFVPEGTGPSARGQLNPRGRFTLTTFKRDDGAVAGRHRIVVIQPLAAPANRSAMPESHQHDEHAELDRLVAKRHADLHTSGLEFEVLPQADNHAVLTIDRQ